MPAFSNFSIWTYFDWYERNIEVLYLALSMQGRLYNSCLHMHSVFNISGTFPAVASSKLSLSEIELVKLVKAFALFSI